MSPRGPTWMPTWRGELDGLCVWAHGYSGPTEGIGGRTRPMWAMQWLKNLLAFIPDISSCIPSCGTNFSFAGDVESRGASHDIAQIEAS